MVLSRYGLEETSKLEAAHALKHNTLTCELGSTRRNCQSPRSGGRHRDADLFIDPDSPEHQGSPFVIDPEPGAELYPTAQAAVENEYIVPLLLKANAGADSLTEEERGRLHFWFIMTFRRFEGVYFQRDLGIVDAEVIDGFERSHIAILASKSAQAWWANSKEIFNSGFVAYLEELLQKGNPKTLHPVFFPD